MTAGTPQQGYDLIMSTPTPPFPALHLVVGYDGSPPADRALDAAVRLLRGRTGRIDVVYVAHLTSTEMMSAAAVGEMEIAGASRLNGQEA